MACSKFGEEEDWILVFGLNFLGTDRSELSVVGKKHAFSNDCLL